MNTRPPYTIQQFYQGNPSPIIGALLWQYTNTVALATLVQTKNNFYNSWDERFWIGWVRNVFNLTTANQFGLCVWSIILDTPLYINLGPEIDNTEIWGFNDYIAYPDLINTYWNFGGSDGSTGANFSASADSITLTVEEQRFLLRMKYLKCISYGGIPQTNYNLNWLMTDSVRLGAFIPDTPVADPIILAGTLSNGSPIVTGISSTADLRVGMGVNGTGVGTNSTILTINSATSITLTAPATVSSVETLSFGLPTAWVLDGLNMTITYQFNFYLSKQLQIAIREASVLPDPAGVEVLAQYWDGSGYVNF
jgi:hypothetical protein